MAAEAAKPQPAAVEKKKRMRSPNYPSVGLKQAIERLKKFYELDGRAGAKADIAAKHIGFASAHGQAYSVLSALKKFGLVEDKDGRVVPTARAVEIISLPETDERRKRAIRLAATSPQIYAELIEQYRDTGLPHPETLAGELQAYKGFNPNAVKEFLQAFSETLEFSGLTDFSVLSSELKAEGEVSKPKIGEFVQWEPNGVLQFREPKRVTGFSEDGNFLFVEGSNTGIPVAEATVEEAPKTTVSRTFNMPYESLGSVKGAAPPPQRTAERARSGGKENMKQDVFSLAEGEVVISWPTPLSQDSITDLKDWLKIVERKIARSLAPTEEHKSSGEEQQ
jgi:hypothetical protein